MKNDSLCVCVFVGIYKCRQAISGTREVEEREVTLVLC